MSVFDQPSRRNRLGIRFSNTDRAIKVTDQLYQVVFAARKAKRKRDFGKLEDQVKDHINQIVADLYAAWSSDPALFIGYSRAASAFRSGGSYAGKLNEDIFKFVINNLSAAGYIENHSQKAGYKDKSSRMRCTQKLAALIEGEQLSWASISIDPTANTIVMKSKKNTKGNRKEVPFNDGDDPRIPQMRQNLETINKKLGETLINIFVTDQQQADINKKLRNDPDHLALDFTRRKLHRPFVNNSWDEGGRFYGGWWQGVPSEYRQYIQIEGKQTVEWDYSAIHPSILYAKAGLTKPNDAYDIPGWDRQHRPLIKKAFNQLINSSKSTKPKGKWRTLAPNVEPDQIPEGWDKLEDYQRAPHRRKAFKDLTGKLYDDLLQDIINHHEPIADVFFTQSWGAMQRLDSDIAEQVMIELYDQDIVVLPIHDSFIVRGGFEGYLKSAMNRAYQEHVLAVPGLKSDKQEMTFDEWILPEGETGILSGAAVIDLMKDGLNDYRQFETRNNQWKSSWGLVGWD